MVYKDLAFLPSPPQGVWHVGAFPLRAYAGFILLGIIIAVFWSNKRWIARGGSAGQVEAVAVWAIPCGIIGGRVYHVLTDWDIYFHGPLHPIDTLKIWDGGLGIWGAIFFGALGAAYACKKYNIDIPNFADAVAPAIACAQAIGRLGNYFNQELFGRPTKLPWGLIIYDRTDGKNVGYNVINGVSTGEIYRIVQPTFLYEMIWDLITVAVIIYAERKFRFAFGQVFALYVACYCFGRFFVELLRDDPATHVFGLRINTITSAVLYFAALLWLIRSRLNTVTIEEDILPSTSEDAPTTHQPKQSQRQHDAQRDEQHDRTEENFAPAKPKKIKPVVKPYESKKNS